MRDELRHAIENRLVIHCNYHSRPRVGQPYLLGVKEGHLTLEIYQTEGQSHGTKLPQWRHFKVSDMTDLKVTDESFIVRGDFNSFRRIWQRILASV
jgi:hypothetical protein